MKLVSIMAVAALGAVLAVPVAGQTVQDFLKPVEKPKGPVTAENYVDPQIADRRACKDRPGRPGWLMVQPKVEGDSGVGSFGWRQEIGQKFVSFKVVSSVIEAGKCTCELKYPDIDQFRDEIEALWANWDNKPWRGFSNEEVREFYRVEDSISRSYSSDLAPFARMCSTAGI
ncbi:MAG: hypothetical protein IBX58_15515 [Roseovarius sp.]|nr:hypothetical protein [Roseovarius sp.]